MKILLKKLNWLEWMVRDVTAQGHKENSSFLGRHRHLDKEPATLNNCAFIQ